MILENSDLYTVFLDITSIFFPIYMKFLHVDPSTQALSSRELDTYIDTIRM
jgi:hypothetical protein